MRDTKNISEALEDAMEEVGGFVDGVANELEYIRSQMETVNNKMKKDEIIDLVASLKRELAELIEKLQ